MTSAAIPTAADVASTLELMLEPRWSPGPTYTAIAQELVALRARVASIDGKLRGLTLPEPPSSNRWWRQTVIPAAKGRPARAMTYLSEEAREYKADAAVLVRTTPIDGPVRVSLDWFRGRAAGDLDKRIGVILDALQGRFYHNDAQIVELRARRFDDKGKARIVVRVDPVVEAQTSIFTEATA